jgi:hypothetical protein
MSNPSEIELPRPEKRRRTEDQNRLEGLKNRLLEAVQAAVKPPARVYLGETPLAPEMVTALTQWAYRYDYVLHYKAKRKRIDDIPGDVRHEGRDASVYTIELYWVSSSGQ